MAAIGGMRLNPKLERLEKPPDNVLEYVDEMGEGIGGLYGPDAEAEYRATVEHSLVATLAHPSVDAVAVFDGKVCAGILIGICHGVAGQITFVHVLKRYSGLKFEGRLLGESVRTFQAAGVESILSEYLPLCSLETEAVYRKLGFTHVERSLMAVRVERISPTAPCPCASTPLRQEDMPEAADVIAAAYVDHPDRLLHVDVCSVEGASEFLGRYAEGSYGETRSAFARGVRLDGGLAGVTLACRLLGKQGFILQVAVRPEVQRKGVGERLVCDLLGEFRAAGLERAILGVTKSNPAVRLYARLGFEPIRTIDAFVWLRP